MSDRWTERIRRADPARRRWLHEARVTALALRVLIDDPGKTEHVFEVLENFPVMDLMRWSTRRLPILRDPRFVALWERRNRPDFSTAAALRMCELPAGTLGQAYGAFVAARGLDNIFLEYMVIDAPEKYLGWRTAHLHDLVHFVLGYWPYDDIGEMEVEAFLLAQTGALNHILFLAGYLAHLARTDRHALVTSLPRLRAAHAYGRRAAPVLLVEWETLLHEPLDDVRRRLRIDERPVTPLPRATSPPPDLATRPRLAHTVHNVPDLAAAVAFYRAVFGYQVATVDRALGVTFLTAGDDHHTLALQEAPSLGPRGLVDGARRLLALVRAARSSERSASGRRRVLPTWPVLRAGLRRGHNHSGYRVPDEEALRALVERLRTAGGRVVWSVNHGDMLKGVYFLDPAGNLCEAFVDGDAARDLRERIARGEPFAAMAPAELANYELDLVTELGV